MQDPDPERNREILASRSNWPDGALEECRRLEAEFAGWHVAYTNGGVPARPNAGYIAMTKTSGYRGYTEPLFAPDPEAMSELIREHADRA